MELAFEGILGTSFQMMGNLSLSVRLKDHPDVGRTNEFFEVFKGQKCKLLLDIDESIEGSEKGQIVQREVATGGEPA